MTNQSSVEKPKDLVVSPPPQINGTMSKTRVMTYTFIALLIITIATAAIWWPVMTPTEMQMATFTEAGLTGFLAMPLGAILLVNALIAVGVAVLSDFIIGKAAADSEVNTMSAAVFGLIVTLCYSLGLPGMAKAVEVMPLEVLSAPGCFIFIALTSFLGLVIFKKLQGMAGRKYLNPAAAAKFIVLLPFLFSTFLIKEHWAPYDAGGLSMPQLTSAITKESFGVYLQGCYGNPGLTSHPSTESLMLLTKFHGWPGGASSIVVIIVGVALIFLLRNYFKWKITATYFGSVTVMSLIMTGIYGGDPMTRLLFELFIGSSIFLGFFMATDPATTPYTRNGQIIFGIGLGVLTVLIQMYMNFFGGALLALLIMNLTVPLLDRIGINKPFGR
ncbi:MAG: RnfABCDGE type electron transport complex subunit D [Candidatus Bathyarchaeota archaeon]|uniref:RnfABCDGE type electron transport complex subunit D n=1 Tax=Candidatus Bathycorpusculum sp. TaxID=2994959 RepID=UPI00282CDA27|nr:RnfABCDGE type electron transport complex subunit D [Candidatus Termiticorpusculum sp.]MCL2256828.1 RnfABCDGE type electron transport complex subunit D [Candidatus Termiticorpusculum sp.]MCL2293093.1 RnfABCDGE type electron transport complex subunit D [Candidatus Termiticorpusculum sp.]